MRVTRLMLIAATGLMLAACGSKPLPEATEHVRVRGSIDQHLRVRTAAVSAAARCRPSSRRWKRRRPPV